VGKSGGPQLGLLPSRSHRLSGISCSLPVFLATLFCLVSGPGCLRRAPWGGGEFSARQSRRPTGLIPFPSLSSPSPPMDEVPRQVRPIPQCVWLIKRHPAGAHARAHANASGIRLIPPGRCVRQPSPPGRSPHIRGSTSPAPSSSSSSSSSSKRSADLYDGSWAGWLTTLVAGRPASDSDGRRRLDPKVDEASEYVSFPRFPRTPQK
jgi:hypothetical protein